MKRKKRKHRIVKRWDFSRRICYEFAEMLFYFVCLEVVYQRKCNDTLPLTKQDLLMLQI